MPSKSKKQSRMMFAAAKDPAVARKVGVPQGTAKEFAAADRKKGTKHLPAKKGKR